jgi:hypothetical protein
MHLWSNSFYQTKFHFNPPLQLWYAQDCWPCKYWTLWFDNKFIVDCWPEFRLQKYASLMPVICYLRLWFFTEKKMKILSLHLNWISRQVIWKGDAGKITINDTDYQLQQCHWHSPSEHTFNGSRFVCLPSLLLKFKNYTLMRTLPPTPLNTLQSSHMYI